MNIKAQLLPHLSCEIDVELTPGKLLLISGENGIGKSTFLRYLHAEKFRDAVYCEQKPLEHFYDRPLKKFKGILLKHSRVLDRERFEKLWRNSGLQHKEDRWVSALSGGEGQILKIISQLAVDAEIYLLDEPGQYLDPTKKRFVSELVEELLRSQKSVLVVEHDPGWLPKGSNVSLSLIDGVLKARPL